MAKIIEMPKITKDKKASKARKLVYQGNPLIQSRKYFNTTGTRLFILGLMSLNPHLSNRDKYFDTEFPLVNISPSELSKLFGHTEYLSMLEKECERLFNSSITLKYTDKSFTLMHIFDVMEYRTNDGLYIQFDPKMKEYLLELVKGGYTAINIEQIFKLTSTYAVRLLELCMQYRNMTKGKVIKRSLTIEDIRFYLNVPEDAYQGRIDNFRQFVIDEPIAEIHKITDFRMSYRTEREGRKVKAFAFELDLSLIKDETFNLNYEVVDKLPESSPYADVQGELIKQGFTLKSAKEILQKVANDVEVGLRLAYALAVLPDYERKSPVKNKQGFLRKAILEDWRKNDIKSKNEMNISEKAKIRNQMALNDLIFEREKIQRRIEDEKDAMKKTGITAADLQGEEKPIPKFAVETIKNSLLNDEVLSPSAQSFLKTFKFSVERFIQVYMVKGRASSQNASTAVLEPFARGFDSLADVLPNFT